MCHISHFIQWKLESRVKTLPPPFANRDAALPILLSQSLFPQTCFQTLLKSDLILSKSISTLYTAKLVEKVSNIQKFQRHTYHLPSILRTFLSETV